jgi:thioredoxin reductase
LGGLHPGYLAFGLQALLAEKMINAAMKDNLINIAIVGLSIAGLSAAQRLLSERVVVTVYSVPSDTLSLSGQFVIFQNRSGIPVCSGIEYESACLSRLADSENFILNKMMVDRIWMVNSRVSVQDMDGVVRYFDKIIFAPNGCVAIDSIIPEINGFYGVGVSMDAWSDAEFIAGNVAVFGVGDRVLEQAMWLRHYAESIALICPEKKFRFSKEYLAYCDDPEVLVMTDCSISKLDGNGNHLRIIRLIRRSNNDVIMKDIRYLFVADPVMVDWDIVSEIRIPDVIFRCGLSNGIDYFDSSSLFVDGEKCAKQVIRMLR